MLPSQLVGELIDAAVESPDLAREMVSRRPELLTLRWRLGETALHFLCVERFTEAVRLLVEFGADPNLPNEFGDTPLIDAATLGYTEIAAILLQAGADPNAKSDARFNVLHCAVSSGNAELVGLLLDAGARPDYGNCAALTVFDALPDNAAQAASVLAVLCRHGFLSADS